PEPGVPTSPVTVWRFEYRTSQIRAPGTISLVLEQGAVDPIVKPAAVRIRPPAHRAKSELAVLKEPTAPLPDRDTVKRCGSPPAPPGGLNRLRTASTLPLAVRTGQQP